MGKNTKENREMKLEELGLPRRKPAEFLDTLLTVLDKTVDMYEKNKDKGIEEARQNLALYTQAIYDSYSSNKIDVEEIEKLEENYGKNMKLIDIKAEEELESLDENSPIRLDPEAAETFKNLTWDEIAQELKDYILRVPSAAYIDPSLKEKMRKGRSGKKFVQQAMKKIIISMENLFERMPYSVEFEEVPEIAAFVRKNSKKIAEYAELGKCYAEILDELGYAQSSYLLKTFEELSDEEKIFKIVDEFGRWHLFKKLLSSHLALNGFHDKYGLYKIGIQRGENIEFLAKVAKNVNNFVHALVDRGLGEPGKSYIRKFGEYYFPFTKKLDDKIDLESGLKEFVQALFQDKDFVKILPDTKHVIDNLFDELAVLVEFVPDLLPKTVENELYSRLTNNTCSFSWLEKDISEAKAVDVLVEGRRRVKNPGAYAAALKKICEKWTGIEMLDIRYGRFRPEDRIFSYALDNTLFVERGEKGEPRKKFSDLGPLEEMEELASYFEENDVYIGKIRGVTQVFEPADGGYLKLPTYSRIDKLHEKDAVGKDEYEFLDNLYESLHVDLHEAVHGTATGSPLSWKKMMVNVAKGLGKGALKLIKRGTYESVPLYESITAEALSFGEKKRWEWKRLFLLWYDLFTIQSLGDGKLSELQRERGVLEGLLLYKHGCSTGEYKGEKIKEVMDAWFKGEAGEMASEVRKKIAKTRIGKHVIDMRKALDSGDAKKIERCVDKLEALGDELTAIDETFTEACSYELTRIVLLEYANAHGLDKRKVKNIVKKHEKKNMDAARLAKKSLELLSRGKKDELRKNGLRYKRVLRYDEVQHVKKNLEKLGYTSPYEAYTDLTELEKRIAEYNASNPMEKLREEDYMLPVNRARLHTDWRYTTEFPFMLRELRKNGFKSFYHHTLNCEGWKDLKVRLNATN